MAALRSRRLELIFGGPLDALTADQVRGLVDAGAQEDFDLDFKLTVYGRTDRDRRALAGDVAAFANTAGGVIAIGIDEDDQARATDAPGITVTDTEVGRIQQVVASLVSPMPTLNVLTVFDEPSERTTDAEADVEDDADSAEPPPPAHGFILIAVPRSPSAPHAVLVNDALRYPKRNGATTRYLSEPEVAAAYRDRLAGAARQDQRIVEVEQQAIERLDVTEPWVVVTLVPDLPGDLALSRDVFQSFERQIMGSPAAIVGRFGTYFQRASVGRRRLLADGARHDSPLTSWVTVELHSDGAGVYGLMVSDLNLRNRTNAPELPQLIFDESIVVAVLSGLLHLARHARDRTAAGGNAVVRAQLLPVSHDRPTAIGHTRGFGTEARSRHAVMDAPSPAESVAALDDIAQPGPKLVIVGAALTDEIGQAFGVPEMGQLSRDGELRRRNWAPETWQAEMVAWAEQNGITVTDAVLG